MGGRRHLWPMGLSPRVRGNRNPRQHHRPSAGSIPARAGEPERRSTVIDLFRVYPRACGGTYSIRRGRHGNAGLSPRVRGNRIMPLRDGTKERSIPARAGEPALRAGEVGDPRVYPRACGGTRPGPAVFALLYGLSPRVRGNPQRGAAAIVVSPVYPRACGGTFLVLCVGHDLRGLSPRVRGNQLRQQERRARQRSIPARAGEPCSLPQYANGKGVYPRACGGTGRRAPVVVAPWGLSPRVRGNRAARPSRVLPMRSIPARAGEPARLTAGRLSPRVYPRACGGTAFEQPQLVDNPGLSPRVRGNLPLQGRVPHQLGSIPARAGEPSFTSWYK